MPYVYSDPGSPHIVISNGNVGEYLTNVESEGSLFISRDAGLSWEMLRPMPYIYEIGDSGSIIVIAPSVGFADELEVSFDEGRCWTSVYLDTAIKVRRAASTRRPADP